jgi:hypothetical protein
MTRHPGRAEADGLGGLAGPGETSPALQKARTIRPREEGDAILRRHAARGARGLHQRQDVHAAEGDPAQVAAEARSIATRPIPTLRPRQAAIDGFF